MSCNVVGGTYDDAQRRSENSIHGCLRFSSMFLVIPIVSALAVPSGAQIYRWDNHKLISGTENITPSPGANFSNLDLEYANIEEPDLDNANFSCDDMTGAIITNSSLVNADFSNSNLTEIIFLPVDDLSGANFTDANLTVANLYGCNLTNTNFTDAIVNGAEIGVQIAFSQLASTASYQQKNLAGIHLTGDMTGWNLSGQNLSGAWLTGTTLTNANLTGATVLGTNFGGEIANGFTFSQLASTASYQQGNLSGIDLSSCELQGWDFSKQNLAGALFVNSGLRGANFADANLADVNFDTADLTDADLRGASGVGPLLNNLVYNTIQPDGTIQGLNLGPDETLIVRNNPIAITVTESATFDPKSTLQMLLDRNWTSAIQFSPGVTPQLVGTLDLEFADDVDPAGLLGETFQLFDWNCPLAADNEFSAITTAPGFTFDTSNLYTTGSITLISIPEPASATLIVTAGLALTTCRRRKSHAPTSMRRNLQKNS